MDVSKEKIEQAISLGTRWGVISIALIALFLIVWGELPFLKEQAAGVLAEARWGWLLLGWLFMCSALVALGYRWQALLPQRVPAFFLSASLCAALLLNYAIPGPFGELAAAWFVHKRFRISIPDALAAGTAARLLGLATAALSALVLWLFFPFPLSDSLRELIFIATMGVSFGLGLILFLLFLPARLLQRWEQRNEQLSGGAQKVSALLLQFAKAFASIRRARQLLYATAWSAVGHLLAYIGVAMSIWARLQNEDWFGIAFTYMMGTCIGAVAFLFPGSQIGWDASFVALLVASTDIELAPGTATTLVLRIEQLCMMLLGAVALVWLRRSLFRADKV